MNGLHKIARDRVLYEVTSPVKRNILVVLAVTRKDHSAVSISVRRFVNVNGVRAAGIPIVGIRN